MPRRSRRAAGRGRRGETGPLRTGQTIQTSHPETDWACLTWREAFYSVINVSNRHQDRKVDSHSAVLLYSGARLAGRPRDGQGVDRPVGYEASRTGVATLPRDPEGLYLGDADPVRLEALRLDHLGELVEEEVEPPYRISGLLAVLVDRGQQVRGLVDRPPLPILAYPDVIDHGASRLRGGHGGREYRTVSLGAGVGLRPLRERRDVDRDPEPELNVRLHLLGGEELALERELIACPEAPRDADVLLDPLERPGLRDREDLEPDVWDRGEAPQPQAHYRTAPRELAHRRERRRGRERVPREGVYRSRPHPDP